MDTQTPGRPRSVAEMQERQGKSYKPEEIFQSIGSWKPRASDVVITPFGKCGTTWLQQTFHTLRTRGDMDFDDISRVVPWIEMGITCGIDLNAEQRANPRGFKSHLGYDQIPKGAKCVVSFRDPKDAFVSMYHFMEGWWFEPGSIALDDFVRARNLKRGENRDYWYHLLSFWAQRDNPDVLIFSYEHMSAEPEKHVRKLAKFCGIPLDDELLKLTLERTSLSYMLKHKDRFDDFLMRRRSEEIGGLPPGSDSAKVREGKVGSHKREMSAALATEVDTIWTEVVAPVTGFKDYASLEGELRKRWKD